MSNLSSIGKTLKNKVSNNSRTDQLQGNIQSDMMRLNTPANNGESHSILDYIVQFFERSTQTYCDHLNNQGFARRLHLDR